MPAAKCLTCGEVRSWRNQRGIRLADHRCGCGGELQAVSRLTGEPYKRNGGGYKLPKCALCERRGKHRIQQTAIEVFYDVWVRVEAGQAICWRHSVRRTA